MPDEPINDGSEVEVICPREQGPTSGTWVDHEEWFGNLTDMEVAEGHRLGEIIDVDDDEDNGLDGDA